MFQAYSLDGREQFKYSVRGERTIWGRNWGNHESDYYSKTKFLKVRHLVCRVHTHKSYIVLK